MKTYNKERILQRATMDDELQVNVDDEYAKIFTKYLCTIAEVIREEELVSIERTATDKSYQEIISQIKKDNVTCGGTNIYKSPRFKIHNYQRWEAGYIEGFVRTTPSLAKCYFIWTFIRMHKLEEILDKFEGKLYIIEPSRL